jgi:hypothetical protein
LRFHPYMMVEEPMRTAMTTLAACALAIMPRGIYRTLERKAMDTLGMLPSVRV